MSTCTRTYSRQIWITVPIFIKTFKWWLLPKNESRQKIDIIGTAILVGLFIAEIAAFWNLLK